MPATRLSMRKLKEMLYLTWAQGQSNRQIVKAYGIDHSTVSECLSRAIETG